MSLLGPGGDLHLHSHLNVLFYFDLRGAPLTIDSFFLHPVHVCQDQ